MKNIWVHIALIILFVAHNLNAQTDSLSISVSGYFSNMQSAISQDPNDIWINDNLFHNRLNAHLYAKKFFSASIQVRTRFLMGDQIKADTSGYYKSSVGNDNGALDLSFNLAEKKSFILNTAIDRAWLMFEKGNLNITLGRQRINWGQTFVWNPNDIFNNYSFFDFDYIERPGSDALRIQYYTGMASSVELAARVDNNNKITAAALGRFNILNYDFQVLAGQLAKEDFVVGAGWSGALGPVSFRGETSYIHPMKNATDTSGIFFLSLGFDYSFENSSMIQVEGMYAKLSSAVPVYGFMQYYSAPMSVKSIAFTKYNLFAQYSYPMNPLINASVAGMYFPEISGFFAGPSISASLRDDLELAFFAQYFSGEFPDIISGNTIRQEFYLGFLRLKWNF